MPHYEGTRRGNLVASHPGHTNSLRHGLYSTRALVPRAQAIRLQAVRCQRLDGSLRQIF
jgi:hypothetical protein